MRPTLRLIPLQLLLISLVTVPLGAVQAPTGRVGAPGGAARGPAAAPTPATVPSPPRSEARHNGFLEIARQGNIQVLWVGDSITDWWARSGQEIWDECFAPLGSANFGIAGDTTQGVLWRMQNGELEGFAAKLIILMLGTNNLNRNPVAEIAEGNRLIVQEFRNRQPQAKVLVLGVFPRGAAADNPFRASIRELNEHLAKLADGEHVFFMDIGDRFLAPDGTLPTDVMPDGLHPNANGYQIWADAIRDRVNELLGG
jgi:lysophospholipase L1-like esterase